MVQLTVSRSFAALDMDWTNLRSTPLPPSGVSNQARSTEARWTCRRTSKCHSACTSGDLAVPIESWGVQGCRASGSRLRGIQGGSKYGNDGWKEGGKARHQHHPLY